EEGGGADAEGGEAGKGNHDGQPGLNEADFETADAIEDLNVVGCEIENGGDVSRVDVFKQYLDRAVVLNAADGDFQLGGGVERKAAGGFEVVGLGWIPHAPDAEDRARFERFSHDLGGLRGAAEVFYFEADAHEKLAAFFRRRALELVKPGV